jgi:metallo-beta-lactamase family protein
MKLSFYGAAHEVTGSCFLLEADNKKILVDCGMFQGSDFNEAKNHDPFLFDPKEIDVLLVTHAHLDHVGRIPKLIRDGYSGPIYMTKATMELALLIWSDAYHIMEYNHKKFQSPILYSQEDIDMAYNLCKGIDYYKNIDVLSGVKAVWKDAGHIFGAGFIEVEVGGKKIGFSGDIGNRDAPILKDTDQLGDVDILLCESTYGDRLHEGRKESVDLMLKLIKEGYDRGGAIMVPAFSLERTQEFLYDLHEMSEYNKSLPHKLPIFLDSPLAINALPVYRKYPEYYDREAKEIHEAGDDFFMFEGLQITDSPNLSKKINQIQNPKMIIAGAGMMNGGRILHHAFRYLPDPNSTLILVGFQAEHTLGRKLYEGAERVQIFGKDVDVKCSVQAIGGLSAHADQNKLLSWIRGAEKMPKKVYCVHGEPHAATKLAHKLGHELDIKALIPDFGETVEV